MSSALEFRPSSVDGTTREKTHNNNLRWGALHTITFTAVFRYNDVWPALQPLQGSEVWPFLSAFPNGSKECMSR